MTILDIPGTAGITVRRTLEQAKLQNPNLQDYRSAENNGGLWCFQIVLRFSEGLPQVSKALRVTKAIQPTKVCRVSFPQKTSLTTQTSQQLSRVRAINGEKKNQPPNPINNHPLRIVGPLLPQCRKKGQAKFLRKKRRSFLANRYVAIFSESELGRNPFKKETVPSIHPNQIRTETLIEDLLLLYFVQEIIFSKFQQNSLPFRFYVTSCYDLSYGWSHAVIVIRGLGAFKQRKKEKRKQAFKFFFLFF